jgi:tetratricopeptide (TPR) repeat protein
VITWPSGATQYGARRNLTICKEAVVKKAFPIDQQGIRQVIADYRALNRDYPNPFTQGENMRSMAGLYSRYLGRPDSAATLLEAAINGRLGDQVLIDKCKIDLGDVDILLNIPWESTLLYSQVEKTQKETPLGHEAKLRNAKLSYYQGDFALAKEHLDVLKLATSREIANDAMDLGLLIQDNTAFDTTGQALRAYSRAELLLFQHKEQAAMKVLDSLYTAHPGQEMEQEIIWLKAKVFESEHNDTSALSMLKQIILKYPTGLYGDDAMYESALIMQERQGRNNDAMLLYSELIKQYPGSIFVVDARKRYRALRGDKIN